MTAHVCPPRVALLLAVAMFGGVSCRAPLPSNAPAEAPRIDRPPPRAEGDRLPAFAGTSPAVRGWAEIRGLFWVEAEEAGPWREGRVWDGARWAPRGAAGPLDLPADAGYLVRTSHVSLRTNASWNEAEHLAAEAEAHVERLFATYGEPLDLRFPSGPLTVVAHRHRDEYTQVLQTLAPGQHGWGAFYDAATGTVHVCTEPAPAGALPLVADLRHEMTHQILDLSSPGRRAGAARIPWLWEGFAVHTEILGDGPGEDTARLRRRRFERRRARGETTRLHDVFRLRAGELEGRHYDQLGQLFAFLMADGLPGSRAATLESLHAMLQGATSPTLFEDRLGTSADEVERAWLAHW